jgi:hypothetical protein
MTTYASNGPLEGRIPITQTLSQEAKRER